MQGRIGAADLRACDPVQRLGLVCERLRRQKERRERRRVIGRKQARGGSRGEAGCAGEEQRARDGLFHREERVIFHPLYS